MLSAFHRLGLSKMLSSAPALPRQVYDAIWENLGANFARSGHTDAKVYAWAMAFARVLRGAQRLEENLAPFTALDLLPALEQANGVVVPANATLPQRRAALAVAMRLPAGGSYPNLTQALRDLLGADFKGLRITAVSEAITFPVDPSTGPGNFAPPTVRRNVGRLGAPISVGLGAPQAVAYTALDGSAPASTAQLRVGDAVVVEPEVDGIAERVIVTAVGTAGGLPTFTATFQNAHSVGAVTTTAPWPYWLSTKRQMIVLVGALAALDPEKRRRIHELMHKLARGVSTWSIAGIRSAGLSGPFFLSYSRLDATPIGSVTY